MARKRVVAVGDLHAGHRVGLTCPQYQTAIPGEPYHRIQVELWDWYAKVIQLLKPIDILICNGDAIDGPGTRSGATELITTDPNKQIDIAYQAIAIAEAKNHIFTHGTPYHTGQDTDHERVLADRFDATIQSHAWIEVNGTIFDIKHKIGNSGVPHGKGTPIAKEWLWNQLWAIHDEQPKADVYLRSHVHNFFYCGGPDWLGMTLPALQGQGSKYGARQCSQEVHFGIVWFDCFEDGSYKWNRKILRAESQKQEPLIL